MSFFDPAMAPFTVALFVVIVIAILEVAGLLFGVAISALVDQLLPDLPSDADPSGGDVIGKLFAWLYVGKVPALMLLAAFLAGFGIAGALVQTGVQSVSGRYLPVFLALPAAVLAALPVTRAIGQTLARLLPKETTEAVSTASFIGAVATVFRGEARRGSPAEAKLTDAHGATHYVLIEPADLNEIFLNGAEVMITERSGAVFRGVANASPSLSVRDNGGPNA